MTATRITPCGHCGTTRKSPNGALCDRCADAWLNRGHSRDADADLCSLTSLISQSTWPAPLVVDAHHGFAGEFVRVVAPHSEADPAALLVSLLVAVGNLIGDGVHVRVEGDLHPARLFAVLVGDTSHGRKGTSFGRVRELLTFTFPEYKDRIVNGLTSGEGIMHHVRDRHTEADDGDKEANKEKEVGEPEQNTPDRRLLVVEGEFGQTLKSASRTGNTLSPVIRNFWDSGDVRLLTRNNPLKVTGAHVSLIFHVTGEELATELSASDAANGFSNRILWICTRRSQLLPDGGGLDFKDLLPLCAELDRIAEWAKTPRLLKRDDEAGELWHAAYPRLTAGHPGAFGKATSRAEAQVLRLSVLYAALDCSKEIRAEHLRAALAVWQYAEASARHIFGESLGDKNADRLLRVLNDKPEGLTRTKISHLFDRHLSTDQIDGVLKLISSHVEVIKVATGGRPSERVRLRGSKNGGAA